MLFVSILRKSIFLILYTQLFMTKKHFFKEKFGYINFLTYFCNLKVQTILFVTLRYEEKNTRFRRTICSFCDGIFCAGDAS